MKGYWINRCHVTNSEVYGDYAKLAGPAIEKFGGRFLVRAGQQVELEGGPYERTVLVEFDSMEDALNATTQMNMLRLLSTQKNPQKGMLL